MDLDVDGTPLVWSATSPGSGRVMPAPRGSTLAELSERVAVLRSIGEGYVEAGFPDRDYPYLAFGFRARYAIVEIFPSAERTLLLVGNGVVANDINAEVPILDELATFTGDFVTDVDRAWTLVRSFLLDGSAVHLGTWQEL
ncbi:hypothetical protein OHA72_10325 [Dactylosporangium sp. NBC_01737]|uniref:hypothetical protein n=1 Tax=Dactylosporangium sp. NBC_01737 TaxID=2975959 RepID=UPI002E10AEE0|nr:hypothetical protein OHA72_10325 [Dactylosporangium sp. NBC_01737]